jgi:hypothetical protein
MVLSALHVDDENLETNSSGNWSGRHAVAIETP